MSNAVFPNRHEILHVPVDDVELDDALACIAEWLSDPEGGLRHVVTVNPEFVIAARRDATFAGVLKRSSLATADGVGIPIAARLLGLPHRRRVTGVDLVEGIAAAGMSGVRLFLLGAADGVAREAASVLLDRHPNLKICGTFSGSAGEDGFNEIALRLEDAKPTVLLVAFGHPRQDLWIDAHREWLSEHGILVAIGVGGAFDYLSGRVPRAPRVIRRAGLEWLYRLIRQPWRWRRQLALPLFVILVLRERLRRPGRGKLESS